MKEYGVKVILNDGRTGFITRRLNTHAYEIWVEEDQVEVILSPDEFKEDKKDE